MWNGGCLHLDSHLEKLLEGVFFYPNLYYRLPIVEMPQAGARNDKPGAAVGG